MFLYLVNGDLGLYLLRYSVGYKIQQQIVFMIERSFDPVPKRVCSPLARIDTNAFYPTQPQYLLKSPPPEHHRLKRMMTYSEKSPSQQMVNLSFKENLEPQSRPRFTFSVRSNQVHKKPSVTFTSMATANPKRSMANPSLPIQPFSLISQESGQITQQKNELKVSDFLKVKELGKGKFGTVWLSIHKKSNFLCALKIISKAVVRQQKIEHQVAKEIRIHNSLNHQNIISFYGYFSDKDHFYIVSEYATEGHLFGQIKKKHRLEEDQVKQYTKQTAEGLLAIHRRGFIHRDIKPENLLLQFGTVKICDFGWAAESGIGAVRLSQCGTPLYYSPEIIKKEAHGSKIDVWSLGLLAYELIVGRVPFKIWSEFDLHVILDQQVSVPDYIDASEDLKSFVLTCLVKDQEKRPDIFQLKRHNFLREEAKGSSDFVLFQKMRELL